MGNVKGTCVKSVAAYVKERRGEKVWEAVLAALEPTDRKRFEGLLAASAWYPLEPYNRLLQTIGAQLGGEFSLGIEIGRRITADGLNTVYRAFMGLLSTKYILSKSPLLWKSYFDSEALRIVEVTDHSLRIEVAGELSPKKIYCGTVLGGVIQTIGLTGGKNVRGTETHCRAEGGTACEFAVTWE